MDKQIESIAQRIKSLNLQEIIGAIKDTCRLPESLALGFFALIRAAIKLNQDLDSETIEGEIAASNRPGLNSQQVADELEVQLQQPSQVTLVRFEIIGSMLAALIADGLLPSLRKRGILQISALAVLIQNDDQLEVKRSLARGLYDWRGTLRSDVAQLIKRLPFLAPKVAKYSRKSVLTYPTAVMNNTLAAVRDGGAAVGFFIAVLLLASVIATIVWARTTGHEGKIAEPKFAKTVSEPVVPAISFSAQLKSGLTAAKVTERFEKAVVFVLPGSKAFAVTEALTGAGTQPVFLVNDELGDCPPGIDWLEIEDLKQLKHKPGEATVMIACFVSTSERTHQFQLVMLESREVCYAMTIDEDLPGGPDTAELLEAADYFQRAGNVARAGLELRKARAAAKTNAERGRYHRQHAWLLRSQNASREIVANEFRQALLLLPAAEAMNLRTKLPAEVNPFPSSAEVEASMGQATSLPEVKKT